MTYTLMRCRFGSHLYGTSTPTSDTDFKSVHVPSGGDVIMMETPSVVSRSTNNSASKNTAEDVDDESFSVRKFFDMLKRGDMVAQELLHVSEAQAEFMSPEWKELIVANKSRLVARDVKGFVGYCRTQANKYGIRGSRVAAARNATEMFSNWIATYGATTKIKDVPDFEHFFECFCALNEHAEIISLPVTKGSDEKVNYLEVINRKVGYTIALKEAHAIYKRAFDEFGSRALAAERNEGVDWKALYHAIRVSEQAMELLQTGVITFPRPNAEELLTIKRGEHPYRDIATRLETNLDNLEKMMLTSDLPEKVDEELMDELVHDFHLERVMDRYDLEPMVRPSNYV